MSLVLLDTHAFVWLLNGSERQGRKASKAIQSSLDEAAVLVSAISPCEIAMLVGKGRLVLDRDVGEWLRAALARPGVRLEPLSPEVAVTSTRLPGRSIPIRPTASSRPRPAISARRSSPKTGCCWPTAPRDTSRRSMPRNEGGRVKQKVISEIISPIERVRIDTESNFADVLEREGLWENAPDRFHVVLTNPPFGGKVGNKTQRTMQQFVKFFELLDKRRTPEAETGQSWTVDFAARKRRAFEEAAPHRREADAQREQAVTLREVAKAHRKAGETAKAEAPLPKIDAAEKSARDAGAKAQTIEDAAYDLKAVNPREKKITDTRNPSQLLEAIAAKGREVDAALERLRALL